MHIFDSLYTASAPGGPSEGLAAAGDAPGGLPEELAAAGDSPGGPPEGLAAAGDVRRLFNMFYVCSHVRVFVRGCVQVCDLAIAWGPHDL